MAGLWTSLTLLLLLACGTYADVAKADEIVHNGVIEAKQNPHVHKVATFSNTGGTPAKVSLGCAPDLFANTRLKHHVFSSMHMSASRCIESCRRHHFIYAGVMNGVDCHCSNTEIRGELLEANMTSDDTAPYCNIPCPDKPSEQCGGQDSSALYAVSEDWRYFGCYKDFPELPDLSVYQWAETANKSAHECVDTCASLTFKYAGVQNGGACYCGNVFGRHGEESEDTCNVTCKVHSRQTCGGFRANAIFMTERAHDLRAPDPDELITTLYDLNTARTEISMGLFNDQPQLNSIITPKIALTITDSVATVNQTDCQSNCYSSCGEIYHPEGFDHKGADLVLRLFHLNLRDLSKYVTEDTRRLYVYAQTVVMDASLNVEYSILIRARELILDQSQGTLSITTDSGAPNLDLEYASLEKGLEPNLVFMKQSAMCARILMESRTMETFNKAFEIMEDVSGTLSNDHEAMIFVDEVKLGMAEMVGVIRADVHYVPFYTKTHMSQILESYGTEIAVYNEDFDDIIRKELTKREYIEIVDRMQKIYAETDIEEAKVSMEAAFVSVLQAEATFEDMHEEFLRANETMSVAEERFKDAMDEWVSMVKKKAFIGLGFAIAGIFLGGGLGLVGGIFVASALRDVAILVENLGNLLHELGKLLEKLVEMLEKIRDILERIWDIIGKDQSFMEQADFIEQVVEMHSSLTLWKNLKDNINILMNDDDFKKVPEGGDYHAAMLETCNWGEAMSKTGIELAEATRIAMEKRLTYDAKVEQLERLNALLDALRDDSIETEIMTFALMEQTYDVRLDLNGALLTFCQAYFYENLFECTNTYKPSFGGSLKDLILKINAARKDALLVPNVPSTVRRRVRIEDAPSCDEMSMCPVRYFREHRMFYYTPPLDHKDLWDLDKYRVAEISFQFDGLSSSDEHALMKLKIESTGEFVGKSRGVVYNFMSRGLRLLYEYNYENNNITIKGDVYRPYRNIVSHVTPYTTWVVAVSEDRSYNVEVSGVTAITMTLTGSAVDGGV